MMRLINSRLRPFNKLRCFHGIPSIGMCYEHRRRKRGGGAVQGGGGGRCGGGGGAANNFGGGWATYPLPPPPIIHPHFPSMSSKTKITNVPF